MDVTEGGEQEQQVGCVHHWVIEPPNCNTSPGQCSKCGQISMFQNHFDHSYEMQTSSMRFNKNRAQRLARDEMEAARKAQNEHRQMSRAIERDILNDYCGW